MTYFFLHFSGLNQFILHCTSSVRSPLPKSIRLDFSDSDAVASHTCDKSFVIPTGLVKTDYEYFKEVIDSVVMDNPTFNVV